MKPKAPSQKTAYSELESRLQGYSDNASIFLNNLNTDIASALSTVDIGKSVFRFTDHTELNDTIDNVRNAFLIGLYGLVSNGIDKEWESAQKTVKKLIKNASTTYDEVFADISTSSDTFKKRKAGGLTISQRLWSRYYEYKDFLEASISVSVNKGMNASQIRTALSVDLQDIDGLRSRYKEKFGSIPLIKDVKYNTSRLVASEINMAYRESEQQVWRQLGFVLGFKINLSGSHKIKDICDDLAGIYPKTFKWYGWHPLDRCYMTPVLMSDTDFWEWNNGGKKKGEITDVPQSFKQWVDDNAEKINSTKSPYFFIADNWNGRLKDYARYRIDSNYKDVAFDYKSGGLKATHTSHHLDGKKGWYETSVQLIGYTHGHSVILEKEIDNILHYKNTEGLWNGLKMVIAAAENGSKRNIRNALKHCVSKRNAKVAVIFMPNGFTGELEDGIKTFNGLSKKNPEQWQLFNDIFFISPTEGIKKLPQLKE